MPKLLYSAKRADGSPAEGFVEAASAQSAHDDLARQGLHDIVLHQEITVPQDAKELEGLSDRQVAELARFQLRLRAQPGLRTVLAEVMRKNRFWLAVDVAMFAWGVWSSRPLWMVVGAVLAVLPFALAVWQYRHAGRYQQVLRSSALGEWKQARELAAQLRSVAAKHPQMDFDLAARLACITARVDSLDRALVELDPWRARLAGSPGQFEGRLASVYASAGDRAGYVHLMGQAYELSGHDGARALDYALAQARFGDVAVAEELLDSIDPALLPPPAKGFLSWTRGMAQLRRNNPQALTTLGQALAAFLELAVNPVAWQSLAFCTCDHAIALNAAGYRDQARKEIASVWQVLQAHADKPLLRMLQAEGLIPD